MAYHALYRKWRPIVFDDVIGQSHITNTLKNEINSSRIAHAYLFTGTRGTGKTSTAKILSRAVNCPSSTDGNPCNECEVCKAIMNETCLDVQEIDAASNTGVDNIRDIISQVQYIPSMGKYKVFIIDEVHMLSKGAFNALLKTLEEPPAHVIFILATTEVQQIPATILSRCQRFDFKTISISDIVSNIQKILNGEGINADFDALEYVAYLGDGSMRDSLSILDQCLAFKENNLTLSDVVDVVGAVDDKILYEFATDVANCDTESALRRFNDCVNSGKNFDNIAKGLLSVFREIIMYKINKDNFSVSKLKRGYLESCADSFAIESLVNCINILSECIAQFKTFSSQRVLCECTLIRLTTPSLNTDIDSALSRLSALENKVSAMSNGSVKISGSNTAPVQNSSVDDEIPLPEPPGEDTSYDIPPAFDEPANNSVQTPRASSEGYEKIVSNWSEVMSHLMTSGKLSLYTTLFTAKPSVNGNELTIHVDDPDKKHSVSEPANIAAIKDALLSLFALDVKVTVTTESSSQDVDSEDIFANLGAMEKKFPGNFKLD
ncbi:MAG: DNA polymerase III subunit gamma/tau [Clostridia bacterium]|nr:DNA polymerase III subunit gamma/tau [Clostridia bacterium]